ncbi:MAG: membrane integrity-associated transporter subunit PqiC [Alphaproteobacteria bacterium]|nr:membrane integrity-associated transporter subunit PqiC [Alphaproteobacteria bacterium]
MILSPSRVGRRWFAAGAGLALAGCASLFVASSPSKLYRLTAPRNFPAGLPHVGAQLLIDLPQASADIDTSRISLSRSPLSLDYFADAEWTDRVPDLIQNLLLASFENSGAITAVNNNAGGMSTDFILRTEIRHFEAVYNNADRAPGVWVEVIAHLASARRRAIAATSRFEQHVPAAANDISSIVVAFNSATDAVLRGIVIWTLSNPALSQPRRGLM